MKAIVNSGKEQECLVVYGLEDKVTETIDIGRKRTLENALQMQAKSYEKKAASVVRSKMVLDMRNRHTGQSSTNMRLTHTQQVEEYEKYEIEYNAATKYATEVNRSSGKSLNVSEVGAVYMHLVYTLNCDPNIVKQFFYGLCSQSPSERNIFRKTYDVLSNKKICRGASRTTEYIKCWNAFLRNARKVRRHEEGAWFLTT